MESRTLSSPADRGAASKDCALALLLLALRVMPGTLSAWSITTWSASVQHQCSRTFHFGAAASPAKAATTTARRRGWPETGQSGLGARVATTMCGRLAHMIRKQPASTA